jgi:hypothetical protein
MITKVLLLLRSIRKPCLSAVVVTNNPRCYLTSLQKKMAAAHRRMCRLGHVSQGRGQFHQLGRTRSTFKITGNLIFKEWSTCQVLALPAKKAHLNADGEIGGCFKIKCLRSRMMIDVIYMRAVGKVRATQLLES